VNKTKTKATTGPEAEYRKRLALISVIVGFILLFPASLAIDGQTAPQSIVAHTTYDRYHEQGSYLVRNVRKWPSLNIVQYQNDRTWTQFEYGGEPLGVVPKDMEKFNLQLKLFAAVLLMGLVPWFVYTSNMAEILYRKDQRQQQTTTSAATARPQQAQQAAARPVASKPVTQQRPTPQKPAAHQPQPSATQKRPPQQRPPAQKPYTPPVQKPKPASREEAEEKDETAITIRQERSSVTFDDIAGYSETKRNMEFIVQCLRNPEKLRQVGAKVPAGILLYGPPGTGKTLMAKAIAGTAGVNFYAANASEFINQYVGVGANNIRALYREAKKHAPSVVFIDEIDAIGGKRGNSQNEEYRQTLNALLTEMDGISKDSGVMTIAATNTFEQLDSALIRPGRFDRKIMVPLPNYEDRLAIIQLHAKKRPLSDDVSLEALARDTTGMSGSAIATIMNEASIHAVMDGQTIIRRVDIDAALTQILTNGEAAKAKNEMDLKIAAYHEAGHAVVMKLLAHDHVPKVSIIGSTSGMVGMTIRTENDDRKLQSLFQLRARIIAAYGGRAAEELIFGQSEVTTGAKADIQEASIWIREYLSYGGSNDNLLDESAFINSPSGGLKLEEARALSTELYKEALSFLSSHRPALEAVAAALLKKDTILEDELDALLENL